MDGIASWVRLHAAADGQVDVILLLLVVAMVVLPFVAVVMSRTREQGAWQVYRAAEYRPEAIVELREELRRAGVRARCEVAGSGGSVPGSATSEATTLLVHRDDLEAARRALATRRRVE